MRRPIATTLALLALAVAAPAAQAGTATTADGNLNFTAVPGEVNNITVARVSGETFRLTDVGAVVTAGTGCTPGGPVVPAGPRFPQDSENGATCTPPSGRPIILHLGDQNDRAAPRTSRSV